MKVKKTLIGTLIILIPMVMLAASIKWFNDAGISQKTVLDGTEVVPIQDTGPNTYRWALASDIKKYMTNGVGGGDQVWTNEYYGPTQSILTTNTTFAWVDTADLLTMGATKESILIGGGGIVWNSTNGVDQSVVIGDGAGQFTYVYESTVIGPYAGYEGKGGLTNSILIGTSAGQGMKTADRSVVIGTEALISTDNAFESVVIGSGAVNASESIENSVLIGMRAGEGLLGTSNSIIIYPNSTVSPKVFTEGTNVLNIGDTVFGDLSTHVIHGNGSGLTNLPLAPTIQSNQYFFETNVYITQNLTVESNITVRQNINAKTLNVTNITYDTATPREVGWAGPTNNIDFSISALQFYMTYTPVNVTNYSGTTNGYGNSVMLVISNAASTNISLYLPSGIKLGNGATSPVTVSNAAIYEMWFYWSSNRFTGIGQSFN